MAAPIALVPVDLAPLAEEVRWYSGVPDEVDLAEVGFFVPLYMGSAEAYLPMSRMPRLQVCQLLTIGFESVAPYLPDGVVLCNAAGVHETSTAELAVGLILANLRGIDVAARAMPAGAWTHEPREALADKTVLIIGAGGVGRALQRRLEGFETTVIMVARSARDGVLGSDQLGALLPVADVVVIAVPLTGETAGMVDGGFLARMKDGALLCNVSRGAVVATEALLAEAGRLRASLDVTDPEPLPPDHPLWRAPGVLITPHAGGNTSAFQPRARRLVADQIRRWRAGEPLANIVADPGAGT